MPLCYFLLGFCLLQLTQGQEYILTGPADTQYIPNYRQDPNAFSPFRQSSQGFQPLDSYLPQRDLQTSDLPFHLQQTLPQYRGTTKTPPHFDYQPFQSSQPAPFRNPSHVAASTHRPNYSHLFSHAHNRNPLQTETFLGEITLQSPAELAPQYDEFQPTEKAPTRANFLNHRTRIFAPDSSKKATQVKNYFVNNNGEVFITTKTPFVPKPTVPTRAPTTKEWKNPFSPATKPTGKPLSFNIKSDKKPFVPKNPVTPKTSFDLDSLLEEPIKDQVGKQQSDDVVEIVKQPVTVDHSEEVTTDGDYEDETTLTSSTEYQDDEEEEPGHHSEEVNDIEHDEEYEDEEEQPEDALSEESKPTNTFNEEVEKEEEKPVTTTTIKFELIPELETLTTEVPSTGVSINSEEFNETATTTEEAVIMNTSVSSSLSSSSDEDSSQAEEPELVVSVVTTKSVINNTVIGSATPLPQVTEEMSEENSTDTWVVVASVQTSRSVSGARYLPSPNVEQEEQFKSLNEEDTEETPTTTHHEDEREKKLNEEASSADSAEEVTTTKEASTLTPKQKTSTESLIDKLDRVQSDLSSSLLNGGFNNIEVITENTPEKMVEVTSPEVVTTTTTKSPLPAVAIRKFSALSRPSSTARPRKVYDPNRQTTRKTTTASPVNLDEPQGDEPTREIKNGNTGRSSGISNTTKITVQDVTAFLPPGFKSVSKAETDNSKLLQEILGKLKPTEEVKKEEPKTVIDTIVRDDISAFLPPGYKPPSNTEKDSKSPTSLLDSLLPPGYKKEESKPKAPKNIFDNVKEDNIAAFLPPGYKTFKTSTTTTEKPKPSEGIFSKAKPVEDISSLLPPGFKPSKTKGVEGLLEEAIPVDVSVFLPPGYKPRYTTHKPLTTISEKLSPGLLPPGYNKFKVRNEEATTSATTTSTTTSSPSTTEKAASGGGFKVVFPSRPGGGARKSVTRLTTPRSTFVEESKVTAPSIQKGWPSRATTEFTGWPTPSTTPISIEKLLEAARAAATSTSTEAVELLSTTSTTTTTTTTTTPKPTTPGVCVGECDLAGTIKLVGGAKWAPELLDRNTKEWQILANEVQAELEDVYGRSNTLNKWYKKIRIDGFSEGSVLVDYLVELNDLGRQIDTLEVKKLFHESLDDALSVNSGAREGKALNASQMEGKLGLGNFVVDPKYTDFIVLPKQAYPTVGYAEDNVLLPQWAIAVIVIGLASLLFVIIFGVTVLVNRQKNAKKKVPVPLTEDMLNELNKNHMGGIDNYGAEDLYNMEDVWDDHPKLPKKRSSGGSIHDNSMSNLYDSWRSEWNGYYYNAYYGNNPGSSHGGNGRRRSDYDTNF